MSASTGLNRKSEQARRVSAVSYIRSHAALRGIAAISVVAYHLQFGEGYRLPIETATHFFQRGYLLVDLFFILSGFIISLTGSADRSGPFNKDERRDFYVARVLRIYPLHIFCLCAIVVYTFALSMIVGLYRHEPASLPDADAVRSFFAELFLLQSWIPGAPHWNIPSWSISAEMFAYLLFPLIVGIRTKSSAVANLGLLLVPFGFYTWIAVGDGSLDIIAGLAPLRCLSGFALGMMLFYLRSSTDAWPDWLLTAGQFLAAAMIVLCLAFRTNDTLIIPAFALFVLTTWQDRGLLARSLCNRMWTRLGDLSYSIYLNHVCVISVLYPICYRIAVHLALSAVAGRLLVITSCFAITMLVSRWTYVHVELAARTRLKARFARHTGNAALS